jgi:hypothetical protein
VGGGGSTASGKKNEEARVVVTSIVRFVVSLQRFTVKVVDEESQYMQSLMAQKTRRAAPGGGDTHPDLREGLLKSDLPKAYVSEIAYGHRYA